MKNLGSKNEKNAPKNNKKNYHDGHRKRLKRKIVMDDGDTLENHELLELLLFYSISRKNTNEIAHELLDKFKNFRNLLNAKCDEIKTVDNIKDRSAALIASFGELTKRNKISKSKENKYSFYEGYEKCTDSVFSLMKNAKTEGTYVIWVDRKGGLLLCLLLKDGDDKFDDRLFYCRNIFSVGISGAIVVSFFKRGASIPSNVTLERVIAFEKKLDFYSIPLLEYYLCDGKEIHGIRCERKYNYLLGIFNQNNQK